ncbi:hypothetical protein [Acidithiobacillus thiooxidans]|uniref:Uncharacterized protein n=1 Tax=Acidithiobacillus thiooxidans ATCC 19377 TaxID=637390 RepID=A0A543Q3L2_ACITH|nr:hypothetical protein [Acidithiobacillus thiooxidans]MDX5934952.1 hypothetical protein [Acidithiobacillus thiooxidans]TQN50925.1 hypothetical protein DLNHIDIE_00786 [Acidithiobacillus thiooxidans ATCC 19377]
MNTPTPQLQYTAKSRKGAIIAALLVGGPIIFLAGLLVAIFGSKFFGLDFMGLPVLWAGIYFRM